MQTTRESADATQGPPFAHLHKGVHLDISINTLFKMFLNSRPAVGASDRNIVEFAFDLAGNRPGGE
eukprot:5329675-Amphidinium_carterae.1